MKLIIDIDEDVRVAITRMGLLRIPDEMQKDVDRAIQRGTPLPKGHGRLIYADEIIKSCDRVIKFGKADKDGKHPISAEIVKEKVESLPTADVRENKHGVWIKIHWKAFRCSECKGISEYYTDFCPNCGSVMSESLKVRELGNIVAQGIQDGIKGARNGN